MCRFIFITGGVVSSLGKGIAVSGLGATLKAQGYAVNVKKLDPYLNVSPGTMNPTQHGEVFVTDDGTEADLDLGHYERFLEIKTNKNSNLTSGLAYSSLLKAERSGKYLGATVQVIPHLVDVIKEFLLKDSEKFDFTLCEIGGTVGDIESAPFLEAIRQLSKFTLPTEASNPNLNKKCIFLHMTLLPYIKVASELKTKPTQHSVKTLMSFGIEPDVILCRTEVPMSVSIRDKISLSCNVAKENVIEASDLESIYDAPIAYAKNNLDSRVLSLFGLKNKIDKNLSYLSKWKDLSGKINNLKKSVKIAIIGKYTSFQDAYKSLIESLRHACIHIDTKLDLTIIPAEKITNTENANKLLSEFHGIVIAGGFGAGQTECKINAIKWARENYVPFLGICLGMQLSVIEFCRNILNIKKANSSEFNAHLLPEEIVVDSIEEFRGQDGDIQYKKSNGKFVGKMNLGKSSIKIVPTIPNSQKSSIAYEVYQKSVITERHRHRYQITIKAEKSFQEKHALFSGYSDLLGLPEIFEVSMVFDPATKQYKKHPFFVGVQFHPEFQSTPFKPHPLFVKLLQTANKMKKF